MPTVTRSSAAAAFLLVVAGCSDTPLTTSTPAISDAGLQITTASPRDTRAVTLELPETLPAWFSSAEALVEAVRKTDGRVLVGLKRPGSVRSSEAGGVRHSIPAEDVSRGLRALAEIGLSGELIGDLGILKATVPPPLVLALRQHPWVDFVEPDGTLELAGMPLRRLTSHPRFSQTTPWGVSLVNAPSDGQSVTDTEVQWVTISSAGAECDA